MLRLLRILPLLVVLLTAFVGRFAVAGEPLPGGAVPPTGAAPAALPPVATDNAYRVGAADVLQITVYGEPGLTGAFPVSDSGQVDFPLLGPVNVAGRTPTEVASAIRFLLMPNYLVNPNVTVSVSAYHSQPVQVLGAVARPGVYYLHGPSTVLTMLSEAGGVSRDGVNEVRITRGGENGVTSVLAYDAMIRRQADDPDVAAGDVIFVPQSLVSVMGNVGKPGEIAWRDGLTVSNCIAAVGGALPTADLGHVYILRQGVRTRVNLRKIISGKAPDVIVQPGDRVFVQESAL